ncbi:protein YAE1 homolog isoform X2 [Pleurodeles waltl]|uniref:protein YAE1 homolog isoform X2 n=1 Tax=Pleurodeles waltl TaxID=8319 RepID=UPI00370965BC
MSSRRGSVTLLLEALDCSVIIESQNLSSVVPPAERGVFRSVLLLHSASNSSKPERECRNTSCDRSEGIREGSERHCRMMIGWRRHRWSARTGDGWAEVPTCRGYKQCSQPKAMMCLMKKSMTCKLCSRNGKAQWRNESRREPALSNGSHNVRWKHTEEPWRQATTQKA